MDSNCESSCRSVYTGTHPAKYNSTHFNAGVSNSADNYTLFTAHPVKFISADSQDQKVKHLRLSRTCSDMTISYNKPSASTCKVVDCPQKVSFPHPNDRKYLTCWKC